ncbi:PhnE/PtxC family ABC transporter permease [Mesobacillus zeae]|uniref:ABC transporter permease subunit n=1 Tax=Mesobacillus zeae TaxID=1917180 RepID=A0A398B8K1_9BACI|nr:ABC transporter permease subunit [Mesobacillus zeae]RID85821.1 ABC transporter permease subunit [Mesobacillus zeae]
MMNFELHKRKILTFILLLAFVWSLLPVDWDKGLLHAGGLAMAGQIFEAALHPDFSPDMIMLALESAWITLAYATAGMSLALVLAFFLGLLASGILAPGNKSRRWLKRIFRGVLSFMRAIHELVWALIFVASFGLTPYAAIFALAIPYGGMLGRIFAEMLEDVPAEPIQALKMTGASAWQCIFYGYLPIVRAGIISYSMYRFECSVRSSAIMSFIGLGGLGYQIQLSLDDLAYSQMWTFLFFLILLVVIIDGWSTLLRRRLGS